VTRHPEPGADLTRRTALCGLLVGLAAPGVLAACTTQDRTEPADTSPAPGAALAAVGDVPLGGGVVVAGPAGPVLLLQPTAGTIMAYDARCPHAGSTVNPPVNDVVVCPNHGSEFAAGTGEVTKGPARTGLKQVAVAVSGTQVVSA